MQRFRPVGGGLRRGDRPCQGRGLACAPCSAARSACPAIPSVVGAETRSPVRRSPSLLLCLPFSLHPSNLISCQGEARALSSSSCSCGPAGAAAAGKVKEEESLGERELPPSRPQCCGCSVAGGGLPQLPRTEAGQGEERRASCNDDGWEPPGPCPEKLKHPRVSSPCRGRGAGRSRCCACNVEPPEGRAGPPLLGLSCNKPGFRSSALGLCLLSPGGCLAGGDELPAGQAAASGRGRRRRGAGGTTGWG